MPPLTITAQGTSAIFRQAERAVVRVDVSSEDTSQEKVFKDVTLTANELRSMLKGLSPKTENGMSPSTDEPAGHLVANQLTT
jgi:hypothetical protein